MFTLTWSIAHLTADVSLVNNIFTLQENNRLDGQCQELGEANLSVLEEWYLREGCWGYVTGGG